MNTKKKKLANKKALNKLTNENISNEDSKLLNQSLDIIQNLNYEIDKVKLSKSKLEKDVSNLGKKINQSTPKKKNQNDQTIKSFNVSKLKNDIFKDINNLFELEFAKLKSQLNSTSKISNRDFTKKISDLETQLVDSVRENKKIKEKISNINHLENLYNKFETQIKSTLSSQTKNSKNSFLISEKNTNDLKSEFQNFKKEFLSKEKEDTKKLENNVKSELINTKKALNQINQAKRGQAEFLVDKINEIVENVNSFEKEIQNLDNKVLKEIDEKSKDKIKLVKEDLINLLKEELIILREDNEKDLKKVVLKLHSKEKNTDNSLIKFKDKTLDEINSKAKNIELGFEKVKENVAREVLKINDFKSKVLTEIKEDKTKLSTEIEDKLIYSKKQFESSFDEYLKKFNEELKLKESHFLSKLVVVEDEKNHMVEELSNFKVDIAKLTKEYISKLNEEFEKIKIEESNFEKDKEVFLEEINTFAGARKLELEDLSTQLKNQVSSVLDDEKNKFERHEETFREVFNEKIQNLNDFTKIKLENIEKKFVDKNLKYVQNRIDEGMNELTILESSIKAKAQETLLRVETLEQKEETLAQDLQVELNSMNEKVEERLTNEEKSLNKRFLDIDSDFTNFKGVIIDEVEDLIKEVNILLENKVQINDAQISKISSINNEVVKRVSKYDNSNKLLQNQVKELRDEVSDLRVKMDVGMPQLESMNSLVQMMSEYEQGLINLIKSLKDRGVSDNSIKQALLNKGHPIFYVKMVLSHFDEIKN